MELYLVRHGQSAGNCGAADVDPPLTPLGQMQAAALGEALSDIRFDLIVSSPLIRAVETAAAVAERQKTAPTVLIDPLFAECSTPGDFAQSPARIRALLPNAGFAALSLAPYAGEQARANACIDALFSYAYKNPEPPENMLIVAHGTFNAMLICGLLGAELKKGVIVSQGNACLNRFSFFTDNGENRIRLVSLNDLHHLPPAQRI